MNAAAGVEAAHPSCGWTMSLKTFLALSVMIVGVVAATVAFVPLYVSALDSVHEVIEVLRTELSTRLQLAVTQYFTKCQDSMASIITASRLGALNASDMLQLTPWFAEVAIKLGGLQVYAGFDIGTYLFINTYPDRPDTVNVDYSGKGSPTSVLSNDTDFTLDYNLTSRTNVSEMTTGPNSYDPTKRPWYPPLYARQSWSSVYLDNSGRYSVLTAGGPLVAAVGGARYGVCAVDFPTTAVVTFLRTQKVGRGGGRVFLVDRVSAGVLGGNWPLTSIVNDSNTLRMLTLSDMAQSTGTGGAAIVETAVRGVSPAALLSCAAPCSFDVGSGFDALYVNVVAVADAYGLDMRLVVVIPATDFLDSMDQSSKQSIGATAGAVAGLLIVVILIGQAALQPLTVLEEKMAIASTLSDETVEAACCNAITEVVRIETAFDQLQAELKRVKSFLPQSVLQRLEGDEDSDGGEGDVLGSDKGETTSQAQSDTHGSDRPRMGSLQRVGSKVLVRSDQRSERSVGSRRGGAIRAGLNLTGGLSVRQVTLLMLNLRGFHKTATERGVLACESAHRDYLRMIEAACKQFKGVLDMFSGDHVTVSFNASNSVPSHVTRCAAMLLHLSKSAATSQSSQPLHGARPHPLIMDMAACSGKSLIGNIGTDTIKRFTIIGQVVNQCCAMLPLCKLLHVPNLVAATAIDVMELEYVIAPVALVPLPRTTPFSSATTTTTTTTEASSSAFSKSLPPRELLGTLLKEKDRHGAQDDEWMYQLKDAEVPSYATGDGDKFLDVETKVAASLKSAFLRVAVPNTDAHTVAETAASELQRMFTPMQPPPHVAAVANSALQFLKNVAQGEASLGVYYNCLCNAP